MTGNLGHKEHAYADLVAEMRVIKHTYEDRENKLQKGIEF
jgi:ATP:corrinoid adenosyltransferase